MPRLTVSVTEEQDAYLQSKVEGSDDLDSKSAAMRECINADEQLQEVIRERDRLREQLAATNRRVDEHQELVEYVQEERQLQKQRRQKGNAPVWKRAKYWVFGFPEGD